MEAQIIKETFYVEVTDRRVDLDPPYVWQSEVFDTKLAATVLARKIAASFGRSDITPLLNGGDYLNPNWEKSAKGVKKFLHVDVMVMEWYDEENYDIDIEENIK